MMPPKLLMLELTNRCNANCIYCGRQHSTRPVEDMDLSLFKKIIDSSPAATELHPQGIGEPLLYPHIIEALQYAKDAGLKIVLYTNGSALTESLTLELTKIRVDQIVFSVDGYEKTLFEEMRRGLNWETTLGNIERFQKLKHGDTRTVIRMTVTPETKHTIKAFREFWQSRVDVVACMEECDVPLPETIRKQPYTVGHPVSCEKPLNSLTVKSNGDVILCCRDWYGQYVFGNLHEETVDQIFYGSVFNHVRLSMKMGRHTPYLCAFCESKKLRRHM